MNKYLLVGLCGLICSSSQADMVTVTANPDSFPAGTNVSNAFPGITLTNRFYDAFRLPSVYYSPVFTVDTSSGRSLAADGPGWTGFGSFVSLSRGGGDNQLLVQFSEPTDFLSLDVLRVSNEGVSITINDFNGPYYGFGNEPTVSVIRPTKDITQAWIRFHAPYNQPYGTGSGYGFIDSISFNVTAVPQPTAFASCTAAMFALLVLRKVYRRADIS